MNEIRSGRALFGDQPDDFFRALAHVPPGLMLDVGAAAGYVTGLLHKHSPQSRIVAFEPFPGNEQFFRRNVPNHPNITFHRKAVSDRSGKARFFVSEVVKDGEGLWKNYDGYSSVGFVVDDPKVTSTIDVDVCRLDEVFDEKVRFLKIDVQGGEFAVLDGASRLHAKHGIDLMFVEFVQEFDLLGLILGRKYQVYDSLYTILVRENADLSNWDVVREVTLSTGRKSVQAWPKQTPANILDYCLMYKTESRKAGNYFTDLVCVAPDFADVFSEACKKMRA